MTDTFDPMTARLEDAPSTAKKDEFDPSTATLEKPRTWGEAAKDTGAAVMGGLAGLVKTGGDLYGLASGNMDNAASELGRNAQEYWSDAKSQALQTKIAQRKANIDAQESTLGKAWTAVKDTLTDPALAADTVAENVATMLPGAGVGRAVGAAKYARGFQAASEFGPASLAAREAIAKQAGKYATGASIGTGAVQQGADVSGDIYGDLMKKTDAEWDASTDFQSALQRHGGDRQAAKSELANATARAAFLPAAGISVAANAIPGATYLERALVGAPLRTGAKEVGRFGAARGFALGVLGEGGQEFVEEGGGRLGANLAAQQQAMPGHNTWDGVGENAGIGFAGGALLGVGGGVHGAREAMAQKRAQGQAKQNQPAKDDGTQSDVPTGMPPDASGGGAAPVEDAGNAGLSAPLGSGVTPDMLVPANPLLDAMRQRATDPGVIAPPINKDEIFDQSAATPVAGELYQPGDTTNPLTGERITAKPSEAMGINPADGPLSTGAALAVDTGVSEQMQQAAALAEAVKAAPKTPAGEAKTAAPDLSGWSDQQLSDTFRAAQAPDVRRQLAVELSRRRDVREQQALRQEMDAEQAAMDMQDAPDDAFANVREDAGAPNLQDGPSHSVADGVADKGRQPTVSQQPKEASSGTQAQETQQAGAGQQEARAGQAGARDESHLNALELRLSHERGRLRAAKTDAERATRQVTVDGIEREIAGERKFLGLAPQAASAMSDDALMQALKPDGAEKTSTAQPPLSGTISPQPQAAGPALAAPEFTTIKTVHGDSVTVRTSDLQGDAPRLRQYTKAGKAKAVPAIHRDNLDPTGEKRAANAKQDAENPLFNVITRKDGGVFASQPAANAELARRGMGATHEVVPTSEVKPDAPGFVIRKKVAANNIANNAQPKSAGGENDTKTEQAAAPAVGGGVQADGLKGRDGYDTPVRVNAQRLKEELERTRGEPLAQKPEKLQAIRDGKAAPSGPVEVAFRDRDGALDVNDGRHRIAVAAERGEDIDVFIDGTQAKRLQDALTQPAPKPKFASKADVEHLFGIDKKREAALARVNSPKGAFFFSEPKAGAFIADNGLADTHEVVRDNRRFVVQEKAQASVTAAANEAATSPQNDLPEPTQAQKEAGNYTMGHLSGDAVQGLNITIENPKGSVRSGTSPDGRAWSNTMAAHYGYVKRSEAADGDHVDIFVGPDAATAPTVWVVDQVNPDGTYDEAKVLFGFNTENEAVAAYKRSYDKGWKVGPITALSVDEFKVALADGRLKKPLDAALRQQKKAPAQPTGRLYHVVAINEKTGAKTNLTTTPESHDDATRILNKQSRRGEGVRVQLEEVAEPVKAAPTEDQAVADLRRQLREVEDKILAAAPASMAKGGGDIEAAMKSRKVPVTLKAQRKKLKEQIAAARQVAPEPAENATAAPRPRPGEPGYTLLDARNDLIDLRTQVANEGPVGDDRMHERMRRQEKLVRDMEADSKPAAGTDPAPQSQTVKIPAAIDEAMTADMHKQQARVKRLRTQAESTELDLEGKKAAQLKVTAAETTLRKMRTSRFDAEDAVVASEKVGNPGPFAEFSDFFPSANEALVQHLLASPAAPVDDVQQTLRGAVSVDHLSGADLDTVAGILGVGTSEPTKPAGADQWQALTPAGKRDAMKRAGVNLPDRVTWENISAANRSKLLAAVEAVLSADKPAAPEKAAKKPNADQTRAKADLMNALADLGDILGKGARLNIAPEQEQKLLPVLTRVLDAAFRLGYHKFKDSAKFALDQIRTHLGDDAADALTLDHMQGAYIAMAGGKEGADTKRTVIDVESKAEIEAHEAKTANEAQEDAAAAPDAKTLTESLYQAIGAGNMPKDNPALKKLVEAFDGKPADPARMKQAQEELETAIAMSARDIVAKGQNDKATFDELLRLYESQPSLNIRTSTSVANQAYSTPAPLAFIASRLAGITRNTVAHEPTGGTGMLLIGADPKKALVNELNDLRISALKAQGFAPTQLDAATMRLVPDGVQPDAVVTNPPFGSIKDADGKPVKVKVDGYNIGQIDHLIAARALQSMKDDGNATLILGANKVAGGLSTDDRIFFNWLYSHYNVVGHFEVEGDLYARQGAGWPVRVITINGRQKSGKLSPVAGTIQRADNWSQVYEQFTQSLDAAAKPATGEVGGGPAVAIEAPGAPGGRRPQGSTGSAGNVAGTSPRVVPDRAKPAAEPVAPVPDEQRLNAQSFVPQPQPGQNPAGAERPAKPAGNAALASPVEAAGNEFQVPYVPRSARKDEGVLIPSNMAQPTQDALNRLEDAVGDIDEFARKELGYESTEALHNALMGLQVDSVATAIYQIKQGKAAVIADQTGIGKGRQAASIIRWAARNGMIPVFVSVKPSLFTDMYGDLADIGTDDVAPFILNSDAWVSGTDGEKLFANKPSNHRAAVQSIVDSGKLPDGRNALFMTYSQINTANVQRQALMALSGNAVFVLDESHNAAGASGTGDFMISVLKEARGVTYLSATYAKRPDNMPLYFKTDIGDAAADSEGLADAMAAGGLPLQTVVSNNLVKAGQMFRRERSYDGVSIASTFDTANRQLHERLSDEATEALRAIVSADKLFHSVFVKSMDKALKDEGSKVQDNAGNQVSAGVQHTEFSSVVHNFVRQMLLGLKAQTAADEAIASLKRGEKPIIAVENTMGSFLSEYAAQNNINQGDSLGAFDYRTVLSRALERSRVINVVLPTGDKSKQNIPLSQLDPITRKAYDQAQAVIDRLAIDIPVSPIDWMRAEIARAGFSVAEITGRDLAVDYSNPRKPVLSAIDLTEQRDKVASTRRFNGGELDALILNVAGSTGISLHASEKFADQRQRHMIVAQAAGDINIFMQMLGRVHRTGQVRLPKYTILSVDLPTEKRPTAVLSRKMKSLNANTSSNTESATSVKTADILNKYGDQIVNQYLVDNLALAHQLDVDDLLSSDGERVTDDIARKATGRLALQPIEVQRSFYEDVEAQYDALIEYLNKTNQNDLEPRTFDFDAKEVRTEILFDGPNKTTPFGEDAVYGEYSIKAQGVAMKPEEIQAAIAESLQGKTPADHASEMLANLDSQYKQFIEKLAQASRETAAVANADGEYDNTKHEAIGDTLFINKSIESAGVARQMGADFLRSHAIGKTFRVEINGEPYNAVITNVRNTHKTTGNPFSLSKFQITLAVNGALRSITVPATQFRKIEVSSIAPAFRIETLFKEQSANQRETAKIVTGNLLAAYGEIKGVRGTIISFTKADGTIEQGILLPKLFDFSKNTQGDYRLRSGADALKFLQKSTNKDIGRFGIATRDGQVRVLPRGDGVQVRVPKSKAQGARYFLDKNLIAVAGDFVSSANAMVANVDDAASAEKVLDMLMDKQALYALPSMADEAKSMAAKPVADGGAASFSRAPSAAPSRADSNARNVATQMLVDGLKAKWMRAPDFSEEAGEKVLFSRSGDNAGNQGARDGQRQTASGIPAGLPAKRTADSDRLQQIIDDDLRRNNEPPGFKALAIGQDQLPDAIRSALAGFERATGTRVVVFRNLTPQIADFNGMTVHDGVLYINETAQNPATSTAAHEWLHNLRKTNPELYQQLAQEVRRQGDAYGFAKDYGYPLRMGEEELTAAAVGDALTDPVFLQRLAERDQSAFRRVAKAFLEFLKTLTAGWKDQGSNAYLEDVEAFRDKLEQVLDKLPVAKQKPGAIEALFLRVWHGSPHRGVEKTGFKLNKIGTGEGAQAYGWGMYFASMREVAERYKSVLETKTKGGVFYGGRRLTPSERRRLAQEGTPAERNVFGTRWPTSKAVQQLQSRADEYERDAQAKQAQGSAISLEWAAEYRRRAADLREVIAKLEDRDEQRNGQLYSLDIPIEESDLLDWDKPLSEQPEKVRQALIRADVMDESVLGEYTGQQLYEGMVRDRTMFDGMSRSDSAKAASEHLQSLGIPGLRYLDGNSRRGGQGSHNYVIWDEALMTPEAARIEAMYSRQAGSEETSPANFEGRAQRRPGTAQDKAVMQAMADGKSARDILRLIADTSRSRFNRQVARLLLKTGITPEVVFADTDLGGGDGFKFKAKYSRAQDRVTLTGEAAGQAEQIVLHELIHAATLKALDKPGLHSLQMRRLFEHVKRQGGAAGQYGMKNVGEFVAEAFTNPKFQEALRQLPAPKGGVLQNAWDALVRIVRSIVGLPQRDQDALARALELGAEVMREDKALRARGVRGGGGDAYFGSADLGDRMGAAIKSVTATGIKQRAGFKATDYLGLGLQALGRRQIVDIYGDMLPLAEYNQLVTQMEADKNEGGAEADQLVTRWAKLPDEAKLADLMHDATLAQIDPAKPYVDGDDKARYMTLQGRFNALSAEAKQVYTDTRDSYQAHHARVRSAIKERIERSEIKGERKAALLKQMDDEFFKAVKGVYFPLARFGQYAVTVKGPDGKVESVSRAETKAEAEELRNNLLSAFPRDKGFTVGRVMLSKDFIADRDAVGRGFMTELYQVLDKQDMDAAQRAELEDTLGQLYLSSLPDLSWAKHGIHRKGTPGFSQDARRAYAQNMFHGARYLAKLRYSDLMQDQLAAMQKHVDDWREVEDFDQNSAQRVVDEMNKRHESLMNPKSNPLSTALTSLGFVFHLGLSPASAMVNLSQTALVAYPIMGAKWGFGKASAALLKASKQAAAGKNDITGSLNADERAAYDEAVRAGTIDVTMAHDLAGIAQGEDAGVMWKIRPVMRWASFLFHHAERFNRQVTFVASYRLAREAGADQKAAFEQATKATYDGHFDYSASNRARIMQGNVAKVLLLFKQYGQNMVYTLSRNAYQSIKGTDAEKAEARKALAGLLTSHAMAAGVLGLPMVTTLLAAASMLGGDDDEPWDAKVALQNLLADTFGQKPAEVLAHGLSRLTPWDISGRVGLDRLIFPDVQEGLEGQRLAESAMAAALGPVAGIGVNMLKGAQHMSEGRYALGLEAMLPSALRGPVKAIRYANEGVQDKSGISILDEVSPAAVAGQALGFSPSQARNAQEGKSAVMAHDRALGERRQELLTKAARATMAKDAEARAEAMKEIERFNQKNPTRRITPLNVLQSVRNRNKRIDQAQDGVYLPRNRRDAMDAGRFAFAGTD